jgi:hypothetical protein
MVYNTKQTQKLHQSMFLILIFVCHYVLLNVSGLNESRFQEEDRLQLFEGNPCSKYMNV